MDPTAPKNPLDPLAPGQDPNAPPELNPIQPGQFVVAGGEPPLPQEPATTAPPPSLPPEPLPPIPEPPVVPPPLGGLPPLENPEPPAPGLSLAQETNTPLIPPLEQPDPTPYVSPPATAPAIQAARPSLIQRFRIFLIIGAAIVIVGIISALAWFFIFSKPVGNQVAVSEEEIPIQEPSPPAKRTEGGFADLPSSTQSAPLQSTPSAR